MTKVWTCMFHLYCPLQGFRKGYQVCFKNGECKWQGKEV